MNTVNEFDLITFFKRARPSALKTHESNARIVKGIGDDCAVFQTASHVVVSTDTLVEGRHFPIHITPAQLASRAFHVSVSDIAAMGATPWQLTLAITHPTGDPDWFAAFSHPFLDEIEQAGMSLIGGDTTIGPLSLTLTVFGLSDSPVYRHGAKEGDSIYVTGQLGGAAGALAFLEHENVTPDVQVLLDAYYYPKAQCVIGRLVQPYCSSMIDISDGLLADLSHILKESNEHSGQSLYARIGSVAIPVNAALKAVLPEEAMTLALTGGDDYQLCFTVPKVSHAAFERWLTQTDYKVSCIGSIEQANEAQKGRIYLDGIDVRQLFSTLGYQHF